MTTINRAINLGQAIHNSPAATGYLERLVGECRIRPSSDSEPPQDAGATAEAVARILKSRRYCYLSKMRMRRYDTVIFDVLSRAIADRRPIPFFYDIGGGYHAGVEPDNRTLSFSPGLSELCILRQISGFAEAVRAVYPPGVVFGLVIDNLCALVVNDIPVSKTQAYCAELRRLIGELGLEDVVSLFVESEQFAVERYRSAVGTAPGAEACTPVTEDVVENVARFLGRPCTSQEAADRLAAYERATAVTDRLVNDRIDGLRMTQRASPSTPPFRPFPGGDVRTQAGELVLVVGNDDHVTPRLLTSRNYEQYELGEIALPEGFPKAVAAARFAIRR